jgi:hypothetical protein
MTFILLAVLLFSLDICGTAVAVEFIVSVKYFFRARAVHKMMRPSPTADRATVPAPVRVACGCSKSLCLSQ